MAIQVSIIKLESFAKNADLPMDFEDYKSNKVRIVEIVLQHIEQLANARYT